MGIKEYINKKLSEHKESKRKIDELEQIKQEAYFEEMKKQSKIMGQKQAQIESRNREKRFQYKQDMDLIKYKSKSNAEKQNKIDYFGLNREIPKEIKII